MRNPTRKILSLLILISPALAYSADLEKGLAAYDEGDYATSLSECQPLAEQGDATAQFCVARLYANGFGVAMDDALALKWYGLAAEQGHSEAQYCLGVMHSNGWGVDMNDQAAANWYLRAADQGFVQAQTGLAKLFQKGRGVEQDAMQAYYWYAIAMQLGDSGAKYDRDQVAKKLSQEQVLTAQEMATGWLEDFGGATIRANQSK